MGVLHLQGVVDFLQGEELVALQEEVLVEQEQEQADQPAQMAVLAEVVHLPQVQEEQVVQVGLLVVQEGGQDLHLLLQESLA